MDDTEEQAHDGIHEGGQYWHAPWSVNKQVSMKSIVHHRGETEMDRERQHPRSQLFTVQLWQEELSKGQTEWRGKVQHVPSGHVRYFRDWPRLILFLEAMLSTPGPDTQSEQEQN